MPDLVWTRSRKEPKSNENVMFPYRIIHASSSAGHHHNALSNDLTLKLLYAFWLVPWSGISWRVPGDSAQIWNCPWIPTLTMGLFWANDIRPIPSGLSSSSTPPAFDSSSTATMIPGNNSIGSKFSFVLLHSNKYWLYSADWIIYSTLPKLPIYELLKPSHPIRILHKLN